MKNTMKKIVTTVAALALVASAAAAEIVAALEPVTVYRTPSGKKYHVSATCGGANAYGVSLDDVLTEGKLAPCGKCAKKYLTRVEYDADGEQLTGAQLVTEIAEDETWLNDMAAIVIYTDKDGATVAQVER